jgi:hypothetical protein
MSRKSDIWMPIYIGDLLADTQHLTNEQFGIYHKVFYHQWRHGHLSEEELFAIAGFSNFYVEGASSTPSSDPSRTPSGTPSESAYGGVEGELKRGVNKAIEAIKKLLSTDSKGLLFSRRCDIEKEKWAHKKAIYAQKALRASLAAKRKRSLSKVPEGVLDGLPEGVLDGVHNDTPSPLPKEQEQKQTPPTPSAAQRGIGPQPVSASSIPSAPSTGPKSKAKANPSILPITGVRKGTNGAHSHPAAKNGVAPGATGGNGHAKSGLHPVGDDLRRSEFEMEILSFWKAQNPEHPDYAFTPPDRRALDALLAHEPGLVLPELRRLLRNRASSEINPAAHPAKWLRNIREYSAGPLGKYSKPRHAARAL